MEARQFCEKRSGEPATPPRVPNLPGHASHAERDSVDTVRPSVPPEEHRKAGGKPGGAGVGIRPGCLADSFSADE